MIARTIVTLATAGLAGLVPVFLLQSSVAKASPGTRGTPISWVTPPAFPMSEQPRWTTWSDLPNTNPDLIVPNKASLVPPGQFYADSVPNTLDLAVMCQEYLKGITATLEPNYFYAPPGQVDLVHGQLTIQGGVENWGKSIQAMIMARRISGYDLDDHDGTLTIQQQSTHNMVDPAVNLQILNGYNGVNDGCWIVEPNDNLTPMTVAVESLIELYRQNPTPGLRKTIQQMVDYHSASTTPLVENGESMLYRTNWPPLPDPSQAAQLAPLPTGWFLYPFMYGKASRALATWTDLTGDPLAFSSAKRFTNFFVDHDNGMFWQILPGTSVPIPSGTAHFSGHIHGFVNGLMGVVWTAEMLERQNPGDPRAAQLVSFANAGYLFVRDEFGWAALGNFGEICGTGDMIRLALKLTNLGAGDYYDDVDRWLRNQITEAQIFDTSQIPDVASSDPLRDHVGSRVRGLFYEDASHPFSIPTNDPEGPNGNNPYSLVACGLGNAIHGVSDAWDNIVQVSGSYAQVNLLLNRASPYLDVKSQLPFAGVVDVVTKPDLGPITALGVRIPDWADTTQVRVFAAGQDVTGQCSWSGRYVQVSGLAPSTDYTITFPIVIRQLPITQLRNQNEHWTEWNAQVDVTPLTYVGTFRGNTLVDVDHRPSGGAQLYQRQPLAALPPSNVQAPMVAINRFLPQLSPGAPPVTSIFLHQTTTGATQVVSLGGHPLAALGNAPAGGIGIEWELNMGLDWNGDGIADLFGHDTGTGEVGVWYGDGNGGWSGYQTLGSIGAEWKLQAVRFRRNGTGADIFGQDQTNGNLRVWHTDGTQVTSTSSLGAVGTEWQVSLGDFDGDGILDIMGVDTTTGEIHVWLTDGDSVTGERSVGQIGLEWTLWFADMDGDGLVDVFGRDQSGNVGVWRNVAGDHFEGPASWGKIPLDDEIQLVDLNDDGFTDVFARSRSTGRFAGWYSDGTTLRSSSKLGQVGSDWVAQVGGAGLR